MPPSHPSPAAVRPPRRARGAVALALGLSAMACAAGAAADDIIRPSDPLAEWPRDPVYIFYPRDSCRGDVLEIEVFNRRTRLWVPHPVHPRVPVDSCQLEDAGVLWNELRRRCVEPPGDHQPPSWLVGVDVFDPSVTGRCAVGELGSTRGLAIEITQPAPDAPFAPSELAATVAGRVLLDGLPGATYDVMLAIDTARYPGSTRGDSLLAVQIQAARKFVHRARPRLGDVRIGITTFPGPDRGLPLGRNPEVLDRRLAEIGQRGTAGKPDLATGLERSLERLADDRRDGARRRILLATDGTRAAPFATSPPSDERSRLVALGETLDDREVALHLYALGGVAAAEPTALVRALTASERSRFARITEPGKSDDYLLTARMPYVTWVSIRNLTTGDVAEAVRYGSGGSFEGELPMQVGSNELLIQARSSNDEKVELVHRLELDGAAVKERLRAIERERIERLRREREVIVQPAASDATKGE